MIKIIKVDRPVLSVQAGHPVPTALYQKITGEIFTWVDAVQQEHTHKRCVFCSFLGGRT